MNKNNKILTLDEAYDAMFDYLDKYYDRTKSDDVGSLLGEMSLLQDGNSADSAALEDWTDSVNKILGEKPYEYSYLKLKIKINKQEKLLTSNEAYKAVTNYLERYYAETTSDDVRSILDNMRIQHEGNSKDPSALEDWKKSVDKIVTQNPRVRPWFKLLPK